MKIRKTYDLTEDSPHTESLIIMTALLPHIMDDDNEEQDEAERIYQKHWDSLPEDLLNLFIEENQIPQ